MMRMKLDEAASLLDARLWTSHPDAGLREFVGMIHDSRRIEPGMLFAALPGRQVDGHAFLADARARGAAAALVRRRDTVVDLPQIEVADVVRAMGMLARAWRERNAARVVGITGSNGKTTVKNLLGEILGGCASTLVTEGNYNNEIGVPLTLAKLDSSHRYAVLEMGAGQPGDIAYLAGLVRPDVAVVTNAGPAHLERLGSIEGVARTKGELYAALGPEGVAVINADDEYAGYWRSLCEGRRQILFGRDRQADVRLVQTEAGACVQTPEGAFDLRLRLPGLHNQLNALAATAVALALGIDLGHIAEGLSRVRPAPGRLNTIAMPGGWTLIDDSYNANPASMSAALQVLAGYTGNRVLVLGAMAELGAGAEGWHAEVGRQARALGIDRLLAVGPLAAHAAEAFGTGGEVLADVDAAARVIEELIAPGMVCLVKGSRSAGMERVVERLGSRRAASC
ncbi:MAG: UDP-N-acetylmuramoyl-tripeptide--D-alanyl-D-alanine ligase [Wenzhouxiangellaceae bacterium]